MYNVHQPSIPDIRIALLDATQPFRPSVVLDQAQNLSVSVKGPLIVDAFRQVNDEKSGTSATCIDLLSHGVHFRLFIGVPISDFLQALTQMHSQPPTRTPLSDIDAMLDRAVIDGSDPAALNIWTGVGDEITVERDWIRSLNAPSYTWALRHGRFYLSVIHHTLLTGVAVFRDITRDQ